MSCSNEDRKADASAITWTSLGDARTRFAELLEAYVRDHVLIAADKGADASTGPADDVSQSEDGQTKKPAVAYRIPAGVGKTQAALALIARIPDDLLERGHVALYFPTHDLALQAYKDFRAMNFWVPARVIMGRDAKNPHGSRKLCVRSEIAAGVASVMPRVTGSLCMGKVDGEMRVAECRSGCRYWAQFPTENSVLFLTHTHLVTPPQIDGAIALRIVDEKIVQTVTEIRGLRETTWLRSEEGRAEELVTAAGTVAHALRKCECARAALERLGMQRSDMIRFEAMESENVPRPCFDPRDSDDRFWEKLSEYDPTALHTAWARAAIWRMLGATWSTDRTERLIWRAADASQNRPDEIVLHRLRPPPRNAPLILLDADADPSITEAIAPGAEFHRIDVRPNATVVQCRDKTFSPHALLERPTAKTRRSEILSVIKREAARAEQGALVVAPMSVLRALQEDARPGVDFSTEEALQLWMLQGAQPRWYGPRLLGINEYKNFDVAILIGRLEPSISDIEAMTRAIFADEEKPLQMLAGRKGAHGWLPRVNYEYLMADGSAATALINQHPDPRCAAVLAQIREASLNQAIARLRAVGAEIPKRIFVLTSVPVPGLPVSKLASWGEIVAEAYGDPLAARHAAMELALTASSGRHVDGLRLSTAGLADDAPEVWPSINAAAHWRRGVTTTAAMDIVDSIALRKGWDAPLRVSLKTDRGGRRVPAIVFRAKHDVGSVVAKRWPGLEFESVW